LSERDRGVLRTFAPLRLRPGRKFDLRSFSEAERRELRAGIADGLVEIRGGEARGGKSVDGWLYPKPNLGNFGDDYLYRAAVALRGLGALEPVEAIYLSCSTDREGRALSGAAAYQLTFPANGLPPAGAFWSLSMYEATPEGRAYFSDNPIGRYAIGDRTEGLCRNADGSLTIHLQHEPPGADRAPNWLPAPAGRWRLMLRAYEPGEALLDGRYRVPGVQRIG
jgi:hypothetical protein